MHAQLIATRLAPKKANIMAKMVRGLSVPDAIELLRNTSKKSARLFEGVLLSAMANAEHNFKQNAQSMIVKTVVVNQGTAYRRGVPMARGRVRPIRKFLCHISITLGFEGQDTPVKAKNEKSKKEKASEMTSPTEKKTVQASKPKKVATKKTSSSSSSSK